ncbi:TIGR03619 family F420-dependent LLM class oxidoreductase [Mycobacterium sp. DBP42]|uniref:TIGR03619 family F420-dependent LLM class oxidoreductase n=1 Tax=Mycobacterium sp. DBP42 TaxID=2545267 RepID=UPI00110D094E|nr:TIGR03619 family F420-dependent LLM class oxidoreductase [Mycobacterium sp. DBP42]TMS51653.1 TIGR03619 family F420-dependent LLM class oxidoreductase [Mycobacterium sp. DBP42]
MKYTLEYPSELPTAPDDFLHPEAIRAVATQAEAAGFSAVALSEHPAPSVKWRNNGGHNTLDPISALSFMAAVTTHLRLMTNLYVLPFRNPYLSAKALGSLDLVSGGRLIAGVGAGYLRSEFAAVGVSLERRAELLDEALTALRAIWNEPQTPVSGADFAAVGPVWLQSPTQRPHPPIWIGGNGAAAIRRVVEHGDGWMPIIAAAGMAASMRTTAIEDADQFGAAVRRLHHRLADAGRDPRSVDIQVVCPPVDLDDDVSIGHARDVLAELEGHGATWAVIHVDGSGPQAALDYIKAFGEEMDLVADQSISESRL